ncbi:MAG: GNAT family N-acetyltransferase [Nonlabens sp.]
MTEILHKETSDRGVFYVKESDRTVAELTYSLNGDTMVIDHTEVNPQIEGKGIGTRLTETAVAFAREKNRKINPLCPFVEVLFDRNSQWSDLRV